MIAAAAAIVAVIISALWLGYWLGSHRGRVAGLAEAQRDQKLTASLDYERGFQDGWLAFRHRLPVGQGLSALIPPKPLPVTVRPQRSKLKGRPRLTLALDGQDLQ